MNRQWNYLPKTDKMDRNKLSKKYIFLFVGIMLIICLLPLLLTKIPICFADFSETGQIGDTIGGIMGPFVAIVASGLTFLAFWVQYEANRQQRRDISLERFENTFFQLVQIQENITNNLYYSPIDGASNHYEENFFGRQVFMALYREKDYFNDKTAELTEIINRYIQDKELYILDHYFRHLYLILKFIDNSTILNNQDKIQYADIIRSSLSQYELVFLFYNTQSPNETDEFKRLIEKYGLFSKLQKELLTVEGGKIIENLNNTLDDTR